jgi:lysophospholipase L1-like esterase
MGLDQTQPRRKALLVAGSILAALLLSELFLRVCACKDAGSWRPLFSAAISSTPVWRIDPMRNHARLEGARFINNGNPPGLEYCACVELNSRGMNDKPVPLEKPADEFRVLVLGDSFVEAVQVPREQNFCQRLERLLSERHHRKVRVINAGVTTYSPLLEYLYFTRELRQYQPDAVVQVFFSNDVYDDLRYTALADFGPHGLPVAVGPGDHWIVFPRGKPMRERDQEQWAFRRSPGEEAPWLATQSYLAALVNDVLAGWRLNHTYAQPPMNDEFFILEDSPELAEPQQRGWQLTRRYIGLLKEACDQAGTKFILTSAPIASQVYGHTSYDHFFFRGRPTEADQTHLKEIAAALHAPFVDLLTPLRHAGKGLYYPHDGHWTPKGHRVVAENLAPALATVIEEHAIPKSEGRDPKPEGRPKAESRDE